MHIYLSLLDFPDGSVVKNPPAMQETHIGDGVSIPGLGRYPGEGRERLPSSVFWSGEFHALYSPWGCKESDTTEQLAFTHYLHSLNIIIKSNLK